MQLSLLIIDHKISSDEVSVLERPRKHGEMQVQQCPSQTLAVKLRDPNFELDSMACAAIILR
jgi:hypothetical protein